MITQTINLDLIPGGVKPVVYVNQYDQQPAALVCRLYNGGSAFNVPAGASVVIEGTKPDKTAFVFSAASVSGQDVTINCDQQMTAVAGDVDCELRVRRASGDDTEIIGTLNFILRVEPAAVSDDSVISETMIPLIEQAVDIAANLQEYIDDTLEAAQTATEAAETATEAATSASIVDANVRQIYGSIETAKQGANEAAASANAAAAVLDGLTAEATTLAAGESATAAYDNGVLTLGIPRGATGESGVVTPINSLFSLGVDENGNLYAYSNYEDIEDMWEYNSVTGELFYITPDSEDVITRSGTNISFTNMSANIPFTSILLVLGPTQNLNGYSKPWAGGTGKNKLEPVNGGTSSGTRNGISYIKYPDGSLSVSGTATGDVQFTVFNPYVITGAQDGVHYILSGIPAGGGQSTFFATIRSGAFYYDNGDGAEFAYAADGTSPRIYLDIKAGATVDFIWRPMIRLATEDDASYEPWENVCRLADYNNDTVYLSPTMQIADGYSFPVTLSGNVVGATVDIISGHGEITWEYYGIYDENDAEMTSYLETHEWRSSYDLYSAGTVPTDGAIVWTLRDTPEEFTITPRVINVLVGANNIWTSGGNVLTVKYTSYD